MIEDACMRVSACVGVLVLLCARGRHVSETPILPWHASSMQHRPRYFSFFFCGARGHTSACLSAPSFIRRTLPSSLSSSRRTCWCSSSSSTKEWMQSVDRPQGCSSWLKVDAAGWQWQKVLRIMRVIASEGRQASEVAWDHTLPLKGTLQCAPEMGSVGQLPRSPMPSRRPRGSTSAGGSRRGGGCHGMSLRDAFPPRIGSLRAQNGPGFHR